jgi:flagellar hook-associated protein 1 FlgK
MSLFGSLYIGTSGLQTSQNALNTVAHNLSNVETGGYTRQQVAQADRSYTTISVDSKAVSNKQTGLGVYYSQVRQVRDYFLDQTYREEAGRMSFYQVSYSAFNEVEDLLGELNGESYNDSLSNLKEAVEELAKEPSSTVKQGLLVQRASQFLERSQAIYQDLSDFQDNLNVQVKGNVDRVNEIADRIYELNNSILKIETGGFENANDLRDERNALLDELGSLIHINYSEDYDGAVIVKAEGHQLVTRNAVFEIGTYADPDTGFYTPYWKMDSKSVTLADGTTIPDLTNCTVFDLSQTIATDRDTDIGTIKAQLLARGDHRANYTDTEVDQETYNQTTGQSVIMNVQAEFDKLVHSITTQMNAALSAAADPDNGYMVDSNGNPIQIFQKIATSGYDENGNYIEEDLTPGGESTLYTIANMTINPDLKKEAALLGFIRPDEKEDYATAQRLQEVFTLEDYTLNPNVTNKSNLIDFYSNIVSQVSYSGSVFKSVYENQSTTVESTESARQQVVGVSDDEELSNMIKFQNAYNASSRYINVINEMIEHIINTLGA